MTLAQKQRLKLVVILFIFIMLLFTWLDFDIMIRYRNLAKECTEPCKATIQWLNYHRNSALGEYVFEYAIQNQTYENSDLLQRKDFYYSHAARGTEVEILYHPQNPNIFIVTDESAKEIYPSFSTLLVFQGFWLVVFIVATSIFSFPFIKGDKKRDAYINSNYNQNHKTEIRDFDESDAIK